MHDIFYSSSVIASLCYDNPVTKLTSQIVPMKSLWPRMKS